VIEAANSYISVTVKAARKSVLHPKAVPGHFPVRADQPGILLPFIGDGGDGQGD